MSDKSNAGIQIELEISQEEIARENSAPHSNEDDNYAPLHAYIVVNVMKQRYSAAQS